MGNWKDIMGGLPASAEGSRLPSIVATSAIGGLLGGSIAAALDVGVTEILKKILAVVSRQNTWLLIVMPLLGLALSVLVLYGFGLSSEVHGFTPQATKSQRPRWAHAWRTFPPRTARADLTGDLVAFAGEEDRFPWRLAPIRLLAIFATVGLGAAMGTEAPAAYLGVATGAALGDRWWPRLMRPLAVGGGAAGVAVLMGIPLVGTAYILELGRRHHAPLNIARVTSALVGGLVGWLLHISLGVDLIRLVVPKEPPHNLYQGIITALIIGALSGSITSISGSAIYRAKGWQAHPIVRLALGGLALAGSAIILSMIASPSAAVGPGGGAITWAETTRASALIVLAVALLRAVATTASAAAGGCGGLFVPFMAIGDLGGRVFAPSLGVPDDLAGSAGAAGGISGGYHLPFTAIALVLGQGGPKLAMLTCLATVATASFAGTGAAWLLDRILGPGPAIEYRAYPPQE
jgi:CIC family chloride channel protein